jgi:hypothetical protein
MAMTLPEIKRLTDHNLHTDAMIQGCLYLGLPEDGYMVGALQSIEKRQNELGHLAYNDSQNRTLLYQDMMRMAELIMGKGEFKEFYDCF